MKCSHLGKKSAFKNMHEIQVYYATFGVTCVVLDSSALLSVYSIYIIVYYIIIYKYLKNIFSCLFDVLPFDKFDWHLLASRLSFL